MLGNVMTACAGMTGGFSGMGMLFGLVLTVGFWGLLIWGGVALYRTLAGSRGAEETLTRRFARGEIDEDEYHRRLDVLRGAPRP
jgi:putative membrane protein